MFLIANSYLFELFHWTNWRSWCITFHCDYIWQIKIERWNNKILWLTSKQRTIKIDISLYAWPTLLFKKRALLPHCMYHSFHIMLLLLCTDNTSALFYLLPLSWFNCIHPFLSYADLLSNYYASFPLIPPLLPSLIISFPLRSLLPLYFIFFCLTCIHLLSFPLFLLHCSTPLYSPFSLLLSITVKPCHATYTPLLFADLFNLLKPFAYSRCNFPPRLHLNNTNPVYICQLWDDPIFMNIIEHIPAVRRWCQWGRKNKESHLEAHFSQPRLFSSETGALQWEPEFGGSLLRPYSCHLLLLEGGGSGCFFQ